MNPGSAESYQDERLAVLEVGRNLVFDNIDYWHEVHYMTEEHDRELSWQPKTGFLGSTYCTVSDQQPVGGVLQLENGKCLPSSHDNVKQRDNYIVLVGRVIAANTKCLRFLLDVTTPHITETVSVII